MITFIPEIVYGSLLAIDVYDRWNNPVVGTFIDFRAVVDGVTSRDDAPENGAAV